MGEGGASGAVVVGARAAVLRRRRCVHVLHIGFGKSRGGGREPCGQHRRQFGAGIVHSHRRLLPSKAKGGTECPCFARHCAGVRAGVRAGVSRRRGSRA